MSGTEEWIEQLRQYFFPPKAEDLNIEAAIQLKRKFIPKKLYKFRAVNDYSLENFRSNTLWLTHASEFNDPYDSSVCFAFEQESQKIIFRQSLMRMLDTGETNFLNSSSVEDILNAPDPLREMIERAAKEDDSGIEIEHIDKLYETFMEYNEKFQLEINASYNNTLKQGYKICSFAARLDSILMWSHYAFNHTGFAMEYDFANLPHSDPSQRMLWPVIYQNELFDISPYITEFIKSRSFNNLYGIISAIHKAEEWSYENEWRFLASQCSPNDKPQNYPMPKPTAVYLGSHIGDDDADTVSQIAREKKIPVYRMKLAYNKFKMEVSLDE